MSLLTVLLPVRNVAATLDQALGSLRAQTFTDWEALVVDDGSTDETPAILAAWARKEARLRILTHRQGRGIVPSLARALALTRTPLLARMDGDDCCLPRRFEAQMELLRAGGVAAVGCGVRYVARHSIGEGSRRYEAWLNSLVTPQDHDRDMFIECPLAHPTLMASTEVVRAVGGYRDRGWPEDYDLLLRLWHAGHPMAKVPEVLFLWRDSPQRTSRTHPMYGPEAFWRCKAHYLARAVLQQRPALIFGTGPVGKALARSLMAEGVKLAAWVDLDPRKIGQMIYGAPVLDRQEAVARRGQVFGLGAVGQPGARAELREMLAREGWEEGREFRCVA